MRLNCDYQGRFANNATAGSFSKVKDRRKTVVGDYRHFQRGRARSPQRAGESSSKEPLSHFS